MTPLDVPLTFRQVSTGSTLDETRVREELATSRALILVDFDHTLFASNSTELFIAECRPSPVVAVVDFAVRRCVPWSRMGTQHSFRLRDYACVVVLVVLMPWNLLLWRRAAPALFAGHQPPRLGEVLSAVDPSRLVIISFGMRFVIRALLQGSPYEPCRVIATPQLARLARFSEGKVPLALAALPREDVVGATFITDSEDDADLLSFCASGLLVAPQGARFQARQRLYLPMRYTAAVKYTPGYTLDQLLLVDAAVLAISVAHDLPSLWHLAVIAPLLALSFMCVYELGYFENDMHASQREDKPVLSAASSDYQRYPVRVGGWLWATLLAVAGIGAAVLLGELDGARFAPRLVTWLVLLVAVRAVFFGYNRLPTHQRVWVYPLLQLGKYASLLVILRPTVLGIVLVMSQVTTMWVIYVLYRLGARTRDFDKESFRVLLFALMAAVLYATGNLASDPGAARTFPPGLSHRETLCLVLVLVWSAARISKAPVLRRRSSRSD